MSRWICILMLWSFFACNNKTKGLSDGSIGFNGIETVERTFNGSYLLVWSPAKTNQSVQYSIYSQELDHTSVEKAEGTTDILTINKSRVAFKASANDKVNPVEKGLLVSTVSGGKNSFEITQSFKPKTTYAFQIRAVAADGKSDANQTVIYLSAQNDSAYKGCLTTNSDKPSEIKLDFEFPAGAREVRVFRDGNEVFVSDSLSITSFVDKNLDIAKTYQYKCVAIVGNDILEGINQPKISPKNALLHYKGCINAIVEEVNIKISFDFPADADEVVVYRDKKPVFSSKSKAGTAFVDQNLTPAQTYKYVCEARKNALAIKGANELAVEVPDPFTGMLGCLSGLPLGSSSIRLNFEFPKVADKVSIQRNGVEIFSTTSKGETSFTDTGLNEAQSYTYRCYAKLGDFAKLGEQELKVSTLSTNPPTFAGIADVTLLTPREIKVKWGVPSTAGVSASYYKIYVTVGSSVDFGKDPVKTVSAGQIEAVIDGLGDEMPYAVAVRACSIEDICDTNEAAINIQMSDGGAPKTVGAFSAMVENGEIKLNAPWKQSDGAILKRKIFRRAGEVGGTNLDDYSLVKTVNVEDIKVPPTSIAIGNIAEDTKYHFLVYDEDPSGNIYMPSNVVMITTGDLTPPSFSGIGGLAVGATDKEHNSLTVNFTAAIVESPSTPDGASHYLIYTKKNGGDACSGGTLHSEVPAILFTAGQSVSTVIENLDEKTLYSVCVKTKDSAGNITKNTSFLTRYTLDKTAPSFDGAQFVIFNNATSKIDVTWNASVSSDTTEYKVKIWKNVTTPTAQEVTTILKSAASASQGFSFGSSDFSFLGNDVVYVLVDACDNAATILGGIQNCSKSPIPISYTVPDITPPQGFEGIESNSAMLTSAEQGKVEVRWKNPANWTDYRGFKVYAVESAEDPVDDNDLVFLKDCPCVQATCNDQPLSCVVTGLNAYRTYKFHVRAYDANGNLTTYLSPSFATTPKRSLDTTAPIFNSGLTANYDPGKITLQFSAATDNQYANEPGARITYQIYRRQDVTFTNATNPTADNDAVMLVATDSTTYIDDKLISNKNLYYTVCAKDASHNVQCDGTVRMILTPDVVAPVIENLVSNKELDNTLKTWNLQWEMSDNSNTEDLTVIIRRLVNDDPNTPTDVAAYTTTLYNQSGYIPNIDNKFIQAGLSGPANLNRYVHYHLTVKDGAGNAATATYTIYSENAVAISGVKRDFGTTTGGKLIVVEGSGFAPGIKIMIGGDECLDVMVYHAKAVGCITPAKTEGNYVISAINDNNTGQAVWPSGYTYVDPAGPDAGLCDLASSNGSTWPEGLGTIASPYKICNHLQFNAIRTLSFQKYFELHDNIDLSSYTNNSFTPIGDTTYAYTFHNLGIEGNNFYIANFTYADPNGIFVGLFKRITGAGSYVKNLNIVNANVSGKQHVGILTGYVDHSDCSAALTNMTVQGTVSGVGANSSSAFYGGVSGGFANGSIDNITAYITLNAVRNSAVGVREHYVGGLGSFFNNCNASNLKVYANITADHRHTGGIFGVLGGSASLTDSIFEGNVTLSSYHADYSGLAIGQSAGSQTDATLPVKVQRNSFKGRLIANNTTIIGAIGRTVYAGLYEDNTVDIKITGAGDSAAGFAGRFYLTTTNTFKRNTVKVNLNSTAAYLGGFVGYFELGSVGSTLLISDNTIEGVIRGSTHIGGFFGRSYECNGNNCINSIIEKNKANVDIVATADAIGGFIGSSYGLNQNIIFRQNVATGNVTTTGSCAGGFVGVNSSWIENSRASGIVTAGDRGGGFAGCLTGHSSLWRSTLNNNLAIGAVVLNGGSQYGGFVANSTEDSSWLAKQYANNFWDKSTTKQESSAGDLTEILGLDSINAKKKVTYESNDWNFTPISGTWRMPFEGSSYPILMWE